MIERENTTTIRTGAGALLAVLGMVLALMLGACAPADPPDEATGSGAAVDERAAARVAMAQSYHVQADVAVDNDDLAAAETAMRELLSSLEPDVAGDAEATALALDASTRLARILVDQGRPEDALAVTDAAVELGGEQIGATIFGGYLYQTRGNIQRMLGDDVGTVASHREAILIFKALLDATRPSTSPEEAPR